MAGETIKTEAICLEIFPWSHTSHIVNWLTPNGKISTVIKGAVRPKSAFLGQYDLNYTCEILYYARAKGELHALRECVPINRRDHLRTNFRALALMGYFRALVSELAPFGSECEAWYELLSHALDSNDVAEIKTMIKFELAVLNLAGLSPNFDTSGDELSLRGTRKIPITEAILSCLMDPEKITDPKILLDTARVIGVFYTLHLDCAPETRRMVQTIICSKEKDEQNE